MAVFISGCVADNSATEDEITGEVTVRETDKVVDVMGKFSVSSGAFGQGGTIPVEYTCDGSDVSPPLVFSGIPESAGSIALIMDDPDAPGKTWVHWVIFNIPAGTKQLSKGIPGKGTLNDGSMQGMTDFGRVGYGGPCPPSGTHRYYIKAYALDTVLDLKPGASKQQLEKVMVGHILAKAELMGRYGR